MKTIAFFGMGNMGLPMSTRLIQAGYTIKTLVFGDPVPLETARSRGAVLCERHTDCVRDADCIISIVPNDQAIRSIYLSPEVRDAIKPGAVIMEMSSCSAKVIRELAAFYAGYDVKVLDSPVTGGVAGAESGKLSILASGTPEDFAPVKPIADVLAHKLFFVGPNLGDGKHVKSLTNMLAMVYAVGIKEFWELAHLKGLSPERLAEIVPLSSCASTQFDRRWDDITAGLFASLHPFKLMFKDMGIALDDCNNELPMPLTNLAYQLIKEMKD